MGNWFSEQKEEIFPITVRKRDCWTRDLPDWRDTSATFPPIAKFQHRLDLRNKSNFRDLSATNHNCLHPIYVVLDLVMYEEEKINVPAYTSSPFFVFYNTRYITENVHQKVVPSIRDILKVIGSLGVCELAYFNQNSLIEKPSIEAYLNAQKHRGIIYKKVRNTLKDIKSALTLGYPIVFGYVSGMDTDVLADGSEFKIPDKQTTLKESSVALIIGFDDSKKSFLMKELNRCFWINYGFVTSDLCGDFWIVEKTVEEKTITEVMRDYQIREEYIDAVVEETEEELNNEGFVVGRSATPPPTPSLTPSNSPIQTSFEELD